MSKDLEYIKGRFDSDGVHAPDSLSEEKMLAMLEALPDEASEASQDTEMNREHEGTAHFAPAEGAAHFTKVTAKPAKRKLSRTLMTVAACLVVTLVSLPVAYRIITAPPNTDANEGDFHTFSSYDEINKLITSINKQNQIEDWSVFGQPKSTDLVETATEDASALPESSAGASNMGASDGEGHSSTYLQVDNVDEADIIKTDGKYIYYVNQSQEVIILEAKDGKTEEVSKIGYGKHENYVDDIFLKGDTLVTVGWIYDSNSSEGGTGVAVYDISDRSNPSLVSEFKQSGSVVSSRMGGDYVYLVTNDWIYGSRYIPQITIDGKYGDMPLEDICCVPNPDSTTYTIVSSIDVTSGKSMKSKSSAVFGSTDTIYCNDHALYAAVSHWKNDSRETTLLRCRFDGLKVKFDKTATLDGSVNDQFSMDEKNGYFRIATTANRNGIDVNNLFILDDKLKTIGNISGFARNESIKAVRYMGDKAYVITYKQIDPLFVIDVSNPEDPKIEGEVKIDGFSSLLVPVSADRLLGIGYATGDNGYGGEYASGLKLALFDISNTSKPTVLDSKEFDSMESQAQYTHLALNENKKDGWYVIPYYISKYTEASADDENSEGSFYEEGGILRFSADDKINVLDQRKLSDEYLPRCVYIGDYIYALNYEGYVYAYRAE